MEEEAPRKPNVPGYWLLTAAIGATGHLRRQTFCMRMTYSRAAQCRRTATAKVRMLGTREGKTALRDIYTILH